jgi:CubicO group peptidase (beta-lactamase class C family)
LKKIERGFLVYDHRGSIAAPFSRGSGMSIAIARISVLILLVASTSLHGQSAPADANQRIQKVETCLPPTVVIKGEPPSCTPLLTRMQQLHIQGVSIAVVHNGVIEWARGYGIATPAGAPVTPHTIFQAGSISKPVAAMAALHLVQQDKLSLDADVNSTLASWKVPPSDAAPGAVVTLRELLTHTAGLTVHGFPGYARGVAVPTLVQVLNGEKPANTAAVRIELPPNTKWQYSGGGYTIMQQMLLDVTHEPFPKLLHDTVLSPIGMNESTYEQPLPAARQPTAATPYDGLDTPVPGGAHTYPEMAAAGLWTTPSDLARFIIESQRSIKGEANHVLSQAMTKQMMTPGKNSWGLGFEIGGSPSNPYFGHDGDDVGFEASFVGYENSGDGVAVMTNAQGGGRLCREVVSAIALAYGWPDLHPAERTLIQLPSDAVTRFVGDYQVTSPKFTIAISVDDGKLMAQPAHGPKSQLFPESPTRFFLKEAPVDFEFIPDDKGEITGLVVYQEHQQFKATKTKQP